MSQPIHILLASNSPRRRELMALGNWSVASCASAVDESRHPAEAPGDYVVRLAETKARAALPSAHSVQVIAAADTAVVDGDCLLGKPATPAEAIQMLKRLRGHAHRVYSGVAILQVKSGRLLTDVCMTEVSMRNYSDAEIEAYVRSGDALDKAGAYAIQHPAFRPAIKVDGCYASVMGLPLCHLARLLARLGLPANESIPHKCQNHLNYSCPVWRSILGAEQADER